MKLTKKQEDIYNKAIDLLKNFKLQEGVDFKIFISEEGTIGKKETKLFYSLQFPLHGNNEIITELEKQGWKKDKRYRNINGNPSFFTSDIFNGEIRNANMNMIRMKYIFSNKK